MKLSSEQHKRGILTWDASGPIIFNTATADSQSEPPDWSNDLTDSNGSIVESLPRNLNMLRAKPAKQRTMPGSLSVRWERAGSNSVVTQIWDGDIHSNPTKLRHLPNYGIYHRLVISTPYLGWDDDVTIRAGDSMLRLVTGDLYGESQGTMDVVSIENDEVSITGEASGSSVAQGRFIEIVASGSSPDDAEFQAHSVAGLASAIFGPHAIGDEVFSEPFRAEQGGQFGKFNIPVTALNPREISNSEIDVANDVFEAIIKHDSRMNRALSLALSWLEKSIRASSHFDQFLDLFVAIESLINTFVKEHGPVPIVEERVARFERMLAELKGQFSQSEINTVKQRLTGTSFSERAAHYGSTKGWDDSFANEVRELAKKRNASIHGDSIRIDSEDVNKARDIVMRLIRATIDIDNKFGWESQAQVTGLELEWKYQTPS